jgi:CRISPR/Cas system-associated exonuclease Cas4 (RecB family)
MQQYKHYAWKGFIDVKYSDFESEKLRLFDKGHNMHDRWANYFDQIGGVLLGRWRCKNKLCFMFGDDGVLNTQRFSPEEIFKEDKSRIYSGDDGPILRPDKCSCGCSDFEYLESQVSDPSINIKGQADLVINCKDVEEKRFEGVRISYNKKFLPVGKSKVVIDMKTCGSNAWKNQIMSKGPHKEYLVQLTIYAHILDCDYGILAYECKDNSKMEWFQVPRNDEWWEVIQYQAKTMMAMSKDKKLPPPKYSSKSNYSCKWCDFKELCQETKRRDFYKCLL